MSKKKLGLAEMIIHSQSPEVLDGEDSRVHRFLVHLRRNEMHLLVL